MVYKKKIEREWTSDTCLSDIVILLLTRPLFSPLCSHSNLFTDFHLNKSRATWALLSNSWSVFGNWGRAALLYIHTEKIYECNDQSKISEKCFPSSRSEFFFCFSQAQLVRVDWWRRCTREWNESTRKSVHPFPDRLTEKTNSRWEDVDVSTLVSGCCRLSVGSNLTTSNKKTACVCEEWENIAERCESNCTHIRENL